MQFLHTLIQVKPSMGNSRIARNVAIATSVVVLAFFVLLVTAKPRGERGITTPLLGNPAPAVSSPLVGGGNFDLARRKGSWVVLNFFNSTCVPCRAEHPQLVAFEKNQSTQDNGVELVTVVNDDSDAAVAAFFEKNGGDWPKVTDPDGAIAVAFGVAKVPETWVIDPSGFVRLRIAGEVTNDFLSAKMAELQRELAAP